LRTPPIDVAARLGRPRPNTGAGGPAVTPEGWHARVGRWRKNRPAVQARRYTQKLPWGHWLKFVQHLVCGGELQCLHLL